MMKLRKWVELILGDISILIYLIYLIFRREIGFRIKFPKADSNEIIVLGNGPSLADDLEHKLDIIKQRDTIVVNFFTVDKHFFTVKPKYLVLVDPAFWRNDLEEAVANRIQLMKEAVQKVDWDFTIYLSFFAKRGYNHFKDIQNPHLKIHYFNSAAPPRSAHKWLTNFLYNRNIMMPKPRNVLIAAIFIAIKMQYPVVKIIGADHSWSKEVFVSDDNIVCIRDRHFYNIEAKSTPWYRDSKRVATFKFHELLFVLSVAFSSYWQLKYYAEKKGVKILNCTKDSFIDAFERAQL